MRPGECDHYAYDSKGKKLATLLRSRYSTEFALERARKAYERGTRGPVSVRPSFERREKG